LSFASDIPLGRLTASQLFLFEDHPEEWVVVPIVLDELYDHEEREKEQRQRKMEDMMMPAMSTLVSPSPEAKANKIVTNAITSPIIPSSLSVTVGGKRRSRRRRPSGIHEDFVEVKRTMVIAMMCMVVSIGFVGYFFDSARYSSITPKYSFGFEKGRMSFVLYGSIDFIQYLQALHIFNLFFAKFTTQQRTYVKISRRVEKSSPIIKYNKYHDNK